MCQIPCLPFVCPNLLFTYGREKKLLAAQEWFQYDHARGRRWRFRWFHGFGGCVSYGQKDLWVRERHGGAQRKKHGREVKPETCQSQEVTNREDVRKHLRISSIYIYNMIYLQYTHVSCVYKLCVCTIYYIYSMYCRLSISTTYLYLYIVRICNMCHICHHHPRVWQLDGDFCSLVQGGPWPYGDTPVWVLTKGGVEIPERLKGNWGQHS